MNTTHYTIEPIGFVRSELTHLEAAPRQGDEGAPDAWLELTPQAAPGLAGIAAGDELIVLTWLHLARRDVLQVHPRGDIDRPLAGVFAPLCWPNCTSVRESAPLGPVQASLLAP